MTLSCNTKKNHKAPVKIRQKMKKTKVFELLYHRMMKNPLQSKPALILSIFIIYLFYFIYLYLYALIGNGSFNMQNILV